MNGLAYVIPSLLRNPRRTAAYLAGTLIAVGLLSSVLFFVAGSAQVLTQRSIASVNVDMQAVSSDPRADTTSLRSQLARQPGVSAAARFALASFSSAEFQAGNRIGQTAGGKIMAVDPDYFPIFHAPVIRQGGFAPGGVVISQDLGTNLGARVGDTLTLHFSSGVAPLRIVITGVASMLNTDALFAPLDPIQRANPFNPPANVVIMDYSRFESGLKPALLAHARASTAGAVVLRHTGPVVEQIQLRIDRSQLPADPSQAKVYTTDLLHRLELALAGRVTILDNVFAALDQAQVDVLWAQVIFVFLTLPGVVLAAALARYVTATVIDAQRRELALLRIRGAGPRHLITLLAMALGLVALGGVLLGLGAGWLTARIAGGALTVAAGPLLLRTILIALGAGLILGIASTFWPLLNFVRTPITQARQRAGQQGAPLWRRLYLDLFALVAGIAVYIVTQRNGFAPVLNAEGNPTISLSFFTFLAPLLFWVGSILLLVRLSQGLVSRSGHILERSLGRGGTVGELAGRTLRRRSGTLHQAVVLVAMAVAFSTGLITFVHTYNQQQSVDASLTLGSDVKVTVLNRAQSGIVGSRLKVAGVSSVTPFRSTVAYVGAEIQDIFGIDLRTFGRTTRLADSFFVGASAATTLHRLETTPHGIIVSAETARDYSLVTGDSLLLRLFNVHSHRYVPTRFRLVGVAREFATAPKDAFLVANLAYLRQATGQSGVDAFLVRTSGSAGDVVARLRARFAQGPAVHVDDLNHVQQQLATSLTSLNLSALANIDYFFTAIMVLAGMLVFALAVLLERAREFAMLEVIGTTPRQLRSLLLIEVAYAGGMGCLFGLAVGLGFAQMLVQILASIFDPPPTAIALPWSSLLAIVALVIVAGFLAWLTASLRLRRLDLSLTLRET